MFRQSLLLTPAIALIAAMAFAPAHGNDSAGGLDATGLFFTQTDQVVMDSEHLTISLDRITVEYVFRNISDHDFITEVIFPMPPVSVDDMRYVDINLPYDTGQENLLNFTATVNGQPVGISQDRIAIQPKNWSADTPLSDQYDTPGTDVTATLRAVGITQLSTDPVAVQQALLALSPKARAQLEGAGLASYDPDDDNGVTALWTVILRYHWTQTFPAGATLRIRHTYDNHPSGAYFAWKHEWLTSDHSSTMKNHCVDKETSRAIETSLQIVENGEITSGGYAFFTNYVLRTASSWAGPIGTFRLTLDMGQPDNFLLSCMGGVKKTGPTTFTVEKTDFTPEGDLSVMVIMPTININKGRN